MENTSTNVIFYGESSPEQDLSIFLIGKSGQTYRLTRKPFAFTRLVLMKIDPRETVNWTITVSCNQYFEPPGFLPTKKAIPVGDYFLKATRWFSIGSKAQQIESNLLSVRIEQF
ncbi:MAG TPA: hypothetical protein VGJ73_01255 [Verrucomicrobiae bacterium]